MARRTGSVAGSSWERSGLAVGAVAAMPGRPPRVATDAAVGAKLPHRTLGRTGASVSILAMGCGSRFLMYPAEQATAVLEKAVGLGIDYLDTAFSYGDGESETRLGRFLATRRKDVFLATKVPTRSRTRDSALKEVEASLKRLQTDHLDPAAPAQPPATRPTSRRSRPRTGPSRPSTSCASRR